MNKNLKKQPPKNKSNINYKKTITVLAILAICIYFIFVLYGLIKEPTNIFMVENRKIISKRRMRGIYYKRRICFKRSKL